MWARRRRRELQIKTRELGNGREQGGGRRGVRKREMEDDKEGKGGDRSTAQNEVHQCIH